MISSLNSQMGYWYCLSVSNATIPNLGQESQVLYLKSMKCMHLDLETSASGSMSNFNKKKKRQVGIFNLAEECKSSTAILVLGFFTLGVERVPSSFKGLVAGIEDLGNRDADGANEVVVEVLVLVEDRDDELVVEVVDPEGELFPPIGV